MDKTEESIQQLLRRDIDKDATVKRYKPALSPYLESSYRLYELVLLGEKEVLAKPLESNTLLSGTPASLFKRAQVLSDALGVTVILYFETITRIQRRALIEKRQPFIVRKGDYFLPQLGISFKENNLTNYSASRQFDPSKQLVFLCCLYADDQIISCSDIQKKTGLSAGSISSALSLFVRSGLVECTIGGKTGRKKSYCVQDVGKFYQAGIAQFGSPVRETIVVPTNEIQKNWLKAGLSALACQSDLLAPKQQEYAVSPAQAKTISCDINSTTELCNVKVLKYDPLCFANNGCVDLLTMLLTIDEKDERVSLALNQALRNCKWYQG
jgi:DNA-binding transcriptional regulator GbsR (MarR family)